MDNYLSAPELFMGEEMLRLELEQSRVIEPDNAIRRHLNFKMNYTVLPSEGFIRNVCLVHISESDIKDAILRIRHNTLMCLYLPLTIVSVMANLLGLQTTSTRIPIFWYHLFNNKLFPAHYSDYHEIDLIDSSFNNWNIEYDYYDEPILYEIHRPISFVLNVAVLERYQQMRNVAFVIIDVDPTILLRPTTATFEHNTDIALNVFDYEQDDKTYYIVSYMHGIYDEASLQYWIETIAIYNPEYRNVIIFDQNGKEFSEGVRYYLYKKLFI